MVCGNIFVDSEGINIANVDLDSRNLVLDNYFSMKESAKANGDTFFCVNTPEWDNLYANVWEKDSLYWTGVDERFVTLLQNDFETPQIINSIDDFDVKENPKTHGGFEYRNHPKTNYIYNVYTWKSWHDKWLVEHPEDIIWDGSNNIFPRYDRIIDILKKELKDNGMQVSQEDNIVVDFHDKIMRCMSAEDRISYARQIGTLICIENYYNQEKELAQLEYGHGNFRAKDIFSIKRDGVYQFLSIDTKHGMFEFFNDNGDHQGELRFDGSSNGKNTTESNHSLICVAEWKHKYKK